MPTWLIIVIVALLVLAIGGYFARKAQLARSGPPSTARSSRSTTTSPRRPPRTAAGTATPREAARRIYAEQHGGAEPSELTLVEILDHPGTDEDQAVFRCGDERRRSGAATASGCTNR